MDLLMNILGYFGTALVVLSFMTNSLLKLRLLNATGAFFVTIYAIYTNALPVVLLDGFIVIINVIQLIRHRKNTTTLQSH